jgi:hypothetical protein
MGVKAIPSILVALLSVSGFRSSAMDRFDALSQIETRNNDEAVGRQQEVSRYQILPAFWAQAMAGNKPARGLVKPTDPAAAKVVVNWIMQGRCRAFESRYHRAPNDFEYYVLWHRPACLIGRPVLRHITTAEVDRARRFASLCQNRD